MRRVYLDHNATSPLRPEVRELFLELLDECTGNASSVHAAGRAARARLDEARERVAAALGVVEEEVLFTSGGTESNNLALQGVLRARGRGAALVSSAIEHSSVLGPARALEREGHPLHLLGVDAQARLEAEAVLERAERVRAALVSVAMANNEVGTIGPVDALARGLARLPAGQRPLLHTDAVQALGKLPLGLGSVGPDLVSLSAHKVGGPLGAGFLIKRRGSELAPLLHGGGQEGELRGGTENVPAWGAAALALELAVREQAELAPRLRALASELWERVRAAVPGARLLGPAIESEQRLPSTVTLLLPEVEGRVLVTRLDLEGLQASAGSACASGSLEPSHVLLALGLSREHARAGLRLSLGRTTSPEDIHIAVEILRRTLAGARKS